MTSEHWGDGHPRTSTDDETDEETAVLLHNFSELGRCPVRPWTGPIPGVTYRREPSPLLIRQIREERLRKEREASPTRNMGFARQARLREERDFPQPKKAQRASVDAGTIMKTMEGDKTHNYEMLYIGAVPIRGTGWGDELQRAREHGIIVEMRRCPEVFTLGRMQTSSHTSIAGKILTTMEDDIRYHIEQPNVISFKVGITWNPPYRWINPKYGYATSGYHRMVLLAKDPDARVCGLYETMMIRIFDESDRCDNTRQGDDNRQDVSPQFVYLAIKLQQPDRHYPM